MAGWVGKPSFVCCVLLLGYTQSVNNPFISPFTLPLLPLSPDPSTSLHVPSIPDFISPLRSFLFPAKLLFSCTGPSNHSLYETSPTKRSPVCKNKPVSGCQQSFSTSLFPHPHLLLFGVQWLSFSLLKLMVSDVVSGQWYVGLNMSRSWEQSFTETH